MTTKSNRFQYRLALTMVLLVGAIPRIAQSAYIGQIPVRRLFELPIEELMEIPIYVHRIKWCNRDEDQQTTKGCRSSRVVEQEIRQHKLPLSLPSTTRDEVDHEK